jgi:hypothetical protein
VANYAKKEKAMPFENLASNVEELHAQKVTPNEISKINLSVEQKV